MELHSIYFLNFLKRFDLTAKLLYAKFRKVKWFHDLYLTHILTFNGGYEDEPRKTTAEEFSRDFDSLINSFSQSIEFKPEFAIPLGNNKIIIEGSHRLVLCYLFGIHPTFAAIPERDGSVLWDYKFFINRHNYSLGKIPFSNLQQILPSMDVNYTDRMALEFCLNFSHFKIVCLFPAAYEKDDQVETLLLQEGTIYYRKAITFSQRGIINLTYELYRGEEWIGGDFPTNTKKGELCNGTSPLRAFIFIPNSETNMVILKKKIRDIYGIGNHSVHIHDTYEEGLKIAKALFNQNSVDFLNRSNLATLSPKEKSILRDYHKAILSKPPLERENFCIDSGFVLALHGIRETGDLDYMLLPGSCSDISFENKDIECHRGAFAYFDPEDIMFNPQNHFYYMGVKVLALDIVVKCKKLRNLKKDVADCELISNFVSKSLLEEK